ncbi:MAG TPA: hypothetical protein VMV28_06690 [Thermoplasmata archaeon]|nr:hypothetical protein [Thermoplasmata archaeon]
MTNNGKTTGGLVLTVIVAALMVLSVALVAVAAAPAVASSTAGAHGAQAYAAPGVAPPTTAPFTLTANPNVFTFAGGLASTVVTASGATFTGNALVYFCVSATIGFAGAVAQVGTYQVSLAGTTFTNAAVPLSGGGAVVTATGSYYIAVTDHAGCVSAPTATYTAAVPITVTAAAPTLVVTTPTTVGSADAVSGTGWDAGATVTLYLNQAPATLGGSPVTGAPVLATFTATAAGNLPATASFNVPALSGTQATGAAPYSPVISSYAIVAQETNAASVSFPSGGITADSTMNVEPAISISPGSTQGASGSIFTITGTGFVAGQSIAASTPALPVPSITIGGITTYHAVVPVSASGGFTVTATLSAKIVAYGPVNVVITPTAPAATDTFTAAVYVSIPGHLPHLVLLDEITSSTTGTVGDPLLVTVYGFQASGTVSIYFDSSIFTLSTDANGFAQLTTVVPMVPGGVYLVSAAGGGYSASASFTVLLTVAITDSSGSLLNGEYAAAGSMVTVSVNAVGPYTAEGITDSGLLHALAYYSYYGIPLVTISNGSVISPTQFQTNGIGVLTITYPLSYHASVATGTPKTITVAPTADTATYYAVGGAVVSWTGSGVFSSAPGDRITASVSKLVPSDAPITPETAPFTAPFSFYIDGTVVVLSTTHTTFTPVASYPVAGSATVVFVIPALVTNGVHTLALESSAKTALFTDYEFIVSTAGATGATVVFSAAMSTIVGGSGTAANPFTGYPNLGLGNDIGYGMEFDLYNFPATTSVAITVYGMSGTTAATTDANGGQAVFVSLAAALGGIPYLVQFSLTSGATITGASWYYETIPAVALDVSSFLDNGGAPATDYLGYNGVSAPAGSSVGIFANSLLPDTVYNVYLTASATFAPADFISTFTTDGAGDLGAGVSVSLPASLTTGTYYLDVAAASSTATSTTLFVTVEVAQLAPAYAFPGQSIAVSLTPFVVAGVSFYIVTAYLNGSAFASYDVAPLVGPATTISVTFVMPNGMPGNYWFVSYSITPVTTTTTTTSLSGVTSPVAATPSITTVVNVVTYVTLTTAFVFPGTFTGVTGVAVSTATTGYSIVSVALNGITRGGYEYTIGVMGPSATAGVALSSIATYTYAGTQVVNSYRSAQLFALTYPTTLVSGNGALITGITPGQVATIVSEVSAGVTTAMKVPLAELNASVVAINGLVAEITTSFGTMTTTLKAINATVSANAAGIANIENGIVSITTTLGTVTAALSAIGATVTTVSNNVIILNTTLGQVDTTLTALNANVASIASGVATLTTDVGQIQVSLTAIGAQLTSVTGTLATITSTLGTMSASLASIGTTVTSISHGVATIQTDLGTLTGNVTSISNGIATIQTNLGTLQASVNSSATSSNLNTAMVLLYVVIVLVIITLALAAVLLTRLGQRRPPAEPPKAYEAPKTP